MFSFILSFLLVIFLDLQADEVDKGGEWSERTGGGEWGMAGGVAGPAVVPAEQGNLELGELEQLTINNDNDLNYDQITAPKVSVQS